MNDAAGASPENPIDSRTPWVAKQLAEYLATDGREPGFRYGAPLLLLTYRGRRSGQWRRTVLIYGRAEGDYLIVASKGGAPSHPEWYLGLQAHPEAWLQVGADRFPVTARTASPEEKARLWDGMVKIYPDYADYQEKTERDIPLVILTPSAA